MFLEDALIAPLLVGNGTTIAATRVYPNRQPQPPTYPLIVYQRISGSPQYTHDGDSGLSDPRYQFMLWAETYAEIQELRRQVKAIYSGYRDEANGIQGCMIDMMTDGSDEQTSLANSIVDLRIKYKED